VTRTLNIAHRGGAALWPENTLYAFVSAAKAGYDGAELDVQLTRDDRLVVFHDFRLKPELCRDSDGRWLRRGAKRLPSIRALTLAELQSFDVGRPKPGTLYARPHRHLSPHDGERMPSLHDVIAQVRTIDPDFRLFIEIKTSLRNPSLSARPEAVAEAVLAELRASGFRANAILVGFDWRGLVHAKRLDPDVPCWFSTTAHARSGAAAVRAARGDGWFAARERATAKAVKEARANGLAFGAWTVNAPREMRRLIGLGVDAICTDRPDRLQTLLATAPRTKRSKDSALRTKE